MTTIVKRVVGALLAVLGLGYGVPYLEDLRDEARAILDLKVGRGHEGSDSLSEESRRSRENVSESTTILHK